MKVNDILNVEIIDLDHEGLGIAKVDGLPIFIDNALPGERVSIMITRVTKNIATAKNLGIIESSPNRREVKCPYYYECGGCNVMHFNYDYECDWKQQNVIKTIKKVAGLTPLVNPTVKNDNIYHYRNKVIIPFEQKGRIVSGFYKPQSHEIVEMDDCLIQPTITGKILDFFKELLEENSISIYEEKTHKGTIRNVMFRMNHIGEIMLVAVVTSYDEKLAEIMHLVAKRYPQIVSMYQNINDKQTNVVLSSNYKHVFGSHELIEEICGLKFFVSPSTFLQVNHDQCEKLYNLAIDYCDLTGNETVIDAYCGMGSISLNLAKRAKYVYGIEIVEDAIKNANNNKKLNSIENVEFICGKCEEKITMLANKTNIDVIVVDPPRKGCEMSFLDTVIAMKIKKIVYISCKCSTFARDAKYLCENGYELLEVTPVDLFSQSSHVESVCLLSLK